MSHRQLDKSDDQNYATTPNQRYKSTALYSTTHQQAKNDAYLNTTTSSIPNINLYFVLCVLFVTYSVMGTTYVLFKTNALPVRTNKASATPISTEQCNLDTFQDSIEIESESISIYNYKHYSFIISVFSNKLGISLTDNKTKYIYKGLFNKTDLEMCGFVSKQTENLHNIFKFIESAINGHEKIKLNIFIHRSQDPHITKLNIFKQDDHFPQNISITLVQIPRKQTDILQELVADLQNENVALKQKINIHGMPMGTIVMWSGNVNDIPHGWMLCDGQNNTPDLRNRFVIGASGEYIINSKGGSKTHTHQIKDNTGFSSGKYKKSPNIHQAHS
eukprot:75929_1